ncbi:MAG: ATP-binding cassette domain-containing protein [Actinomycetota bacterium]|nr:ATP-binding cassette domain-containing protein [Actinomycetota bacterium]
MTSAAAPAGRRALEVRGLCVRLGRVDVVTGVDLDLEAGTVTGLIGPNGAGKTTVVDALSGLVPATAGRVTLAGTPVDHLPPHRRARLGLARTFQSLELFEDLTVAENLLVAAPSAAVPPPLEAVAGARPAGLSAAERSHVALARATAGGPSVLLLDEPAAGLDAGQRRELGLRLRELAAGGMAVLLVDHDMGLVLDVCDRVSVMDAGRVIASGTPDQVRADEAVVTAYLGRPPDGAGGPDDPDRPAAASDPVLEVRGLAAGYGDVPVIDDVDLTVRPGEVVALLGLNGAGKTTTLLAVSGVLAPTAGEVLVGGVHVPRPPHRRARLGVAHVPQRRSVFDDLTVAENLRLAGDPALAVAAFPELEPLLRRRAALLSGGEARMLALGRALSTRPRVLLVDEASLGLGPAVVDRVLTTLRRAAVEEGTAVLLVEQHVHRAVAVADRAYVMERGRIVGEGPSGEVALDGILPG